jgi:hypothetical protein
MTTTTTTDFDLYEWKEGYLSSGRKEVGILRLEYEMRRIYNRGE